jgi:hypothetical protein
MKSSLKERLFCDTTKIIMNATDELKRLSQNGFQQYSRYLYNRWQKSVVAQGDYFEGNLA